MQMLNTNRIYDASVLLRCSEESLDIEIAKMLANIQSDYEATTTAYVGTPAQRTRNQDDAITAIASAMQAERRDRSDRYESTEDIKPSIPELEAARETHPALSPIHEEPPPRGVGTGGKFRYLWQDPQSLSYVPVNAGWTWKSEYCVKKKRNDVRLT